MKKLIGLIVLGLLLLGGTKTNAQLYKGNILLGADLTNLNLGLDKGGNFSFVVDPKVGFFFKDNVTIGTFLLFGLNTAKGAGTSINYGIGGFGRYYLIGKTDSIRLLRRSSFFFEGNAGIEGDNPAVGNNTNGLGVGLGPGWTYFISSNIGVEALLKYNLILGFGSAVTSNNLILAVGFQIYLPSFFSGRY